MPLLQILFPIALTLSGQADLTLVEVIKQAETHSDQIREGQNALAASQARIGQQNSFRNPQLSLVGSATQYDAPSNLSFGGTKVQAVPDHLESLSLQLNQLLDFSNQVGTAVSQARLTSLSAQYALRSTVQDVDLIATTAYYDSLRADESVKVSQASLLAYQEQLKLNTKLYEGGIGAKINVLRAKSQVANAESDVVRLENDRNSAQSRLNDLIGRPLEEETVLAPAASDSDLSSPTAADRAALIQNALDHRTEVLGSEVQVRAAQKGIKLARASTDPQVSIGLSGNYYPTTSFQDIRPTTAALTLGVTIPIYDGGLARDRVHEAKALLDSAVAGENRTKRDVSLQVQTAALDVETARKRKDAATIAVLAAGQARDLAQQRYEAQVSLYLEVTDAQSALTAAQSALVDATYDLLTAQARLARAIGRPLPN